MGEENVQNIERNMAGQFLHPNPHGSITTSSVQNTLRLTCPTPFYNIDAVGLVRVDHTRTVLSFEHDAIRGEAGFQVLIIGIFPDGGIKGLTCRAVPMKER
jgi:hypothetical protein